MDSSIDFRSVFHALPNAYLVVDANLKILDANPACLRNVDMKKEEVVGRSLVDLLEQKTAGAHADKLRESYDEVLARKTQVILPLFHYTTERETADGAVKHDRYWNMTHVPILEQDGSVSLIITHAIEIHGEQLPLIETPMAIAARNSGAITGQRSATPSWPKAIKPVAGLLSTSSQSLRVLLVEDNEDLKDTTAAMIEALGHQVVALDNAERALDLLATESFDVLFTDLALPKTTGAELAREALHHFPSMRVIISSGYGRAMANAKNLDAVFLPKPYQLLDIQIALDGTTAQNN